MNIPIGEFEFRKLDSSCTDEIMTIQAETFAGMDNPDLLRNNSREMIASCLIEPHFAVGAFYKDVLAGFAILYFPDTDEEKLAPLLKTVDASGLEPANFKLCIVRAAYRGNSLQYELGKILDAEAVRRGIDLLCATISPHNAFSRQNSLKLGYQYDCTLKKYGLERELYYKLLNK